MERGEEQDTPPIGGDHPCDAAVRYCYLQPAAVMADPGMSDRGTRLEVKRKGMFFALVDSWRIKRLNSP